MNGNKAIRLGRWINDSFDVANTFTVVATATGIDISLQM